MAVVMYITRPCQAVIRSSPLLSPRVAPPLLTKQQEEPSIDIPEANIRKTHLQKSVQAAIMATNNIAITGVPTTPGTDGK